MIDIESDFPSDKRLIDITIGEFIKILRALIKEENAELLGKIEPVPALEEGRVHPETGLPEAPDEEVGSDRAREILRSKSNPVSVPTLDKYRKKPQFDITGRNIGGYGLPYKLAGHRAMHKVKDLLAFRNNRQHFIK